MTALTDALTARVTQLAGTCSTLAVLQALDPADTPAMDTALADPAITSDVIALALGDTGVRISSTDVQAHRDGRCPCVLQPPTPQPQGALSGDVR